MRPLLALVLVAAVGLGLAGATPASAETTVKTSAPVVDYPKAIHFKLEAASDQEIREVTLRYQLKNRNVSGLGKPDSFTPGKSVVTEVTIDSNPDTNWLPVGNEFVYHWELGLADGSVYNSPDQTFVYLPTGRDWKQASNDLMTVYYYGERAATAGRYLQAATQTKSEIGDTLLKASLAHVPVKVILFVSPDEVAESQPGKGQAFENSGVVTCGYRPGSADDIIVVSAACGGGSSVDTLRHEFGHILNHAAGESVLVKLPSWLDEGLATYAQDEAKEFTGAYSGAARRNALIPFERMGVPVSDPDLTLLYYGQSLAMVTHLVEKEGPAKMAQLMAATRGGTRFDVAFQQVYGFDMKGFEAKFRAANNLPGTGNATPASGQSQATATAGSGSGNQPARTATPRSAAATTAEDDDGDGMSMVLVGSLVFAIIAVLVGVFLFLASQLISRREPPASP